jgi:hypothetical protein
MPAFVPYDEGSGPAIDRVEPGPTWISFEHVAMSKKAISIALAISQAADQASVLDALSSYLRDLHRDSGGNWRDLGKKDGPRQDGSPIQSELQR